MTGTQTGIRHTTLPDGTPAWLVGGYDNVRAALADPRLSLDKRNADGYKGFSLPPALDANLLNMDPPDHTRVRRLVSQAFTARRSEALRPRVQQIADELLDAVEPLGRADLIAAYAGPLPVTVICELLGVADDRRADFRAWTDALLGPDRSAAALAIGQLHAYFQELIAATRERPGDDMLSALSHGTDRLTSDELTSLAFLLLFAGYENVVNLVGTGIMTLLANPDLLDAVRAEPALLPATVEELLRHEPPAPLSIRRFPVEDVTIAGVTVPKGATVLLSLGGANRDPDRFADPDRLDVRRDAGGHLAFGHGIHFCLGAALARVEAEVALGTVLRRLPSLALAVPVADLRWRPTVRTRGLAELPVRW